MEASSIISPISKLHLSMEVLSVLLPRNSTNIYGVYITVMW